MYPSERQTTPAPQVSLAELLTPEQPDNRSVVLILAFQTSLLFFTVLGSYLLDGGMSLGLSTAESSSWFPVPAGMQPQYFIDQSSWGLVAMFSAAMIAAGWVVDRLPGPFQLLYRDTRVFVLRLIGRRTDVSSAATISLVLAMSAAISEELLFRGLLTTHWVHDFGPLQAGVLSSILFGLAHSPFFGFSSAVEACLGGVFAYSYWVSGQNMLVPVGVHFLYDFSALFFTWLAASRDASERVQRAEQIMRANSGAAISRVQDAASGTPFDPLAFNTAAALIFELLDVDADGVINRKDFNAGLVLLGVSPLPLGREPQFSTQLFDEADSNGDGVIDFQEFMLVSRQLLKNWMTMF